MKLHRLLYELRALPRRTPAQQEVLDLAGRADLFYFGDLHLEVSGADNHGMSGYTLPQLTEQELDFWREDLVPLPAPVCWYEWVINGVTSGMLVCAAAAGGLIRTQRFDFAPEPIHLWGVWCSVMDTRGGQVTLGITAPDERLAEAIRRIPPERQNVLFHSSPSLAMYLTLMLNSRTTEVRAAVPDAALNRARARRGRAPLPPHRVVTIVPERLLREYAREAGLAGAPKRLHWRRSHVRVINRGTDLERRVLIPRFLVGRRELGEVTHEYRVGRQVAAHQKEDA